MDALVTGYLARDPEVSKDGKFIKFSVCYDKKQYMNCKVWSNGPHAVIVGRLEKDDTVLVSGKFGEWEYNGKMYSNITAGSTDAVLCTGAFCGIVSDSTVESPAASDDGPIVDTPKSSAFLQRPVSENGGFVEIPEAETDGDLPF